MTCLNASTERWTTRGLGTGSIPKSVAQPPSASLQMWAVEQRAACEAEVGARREEGGRVGRGCRAGGAPLGSRRGPEPGGGRLVLITRGGQGGGRGAGTKGRRRATGTHAGSRAPTRAGTSGRPRPAPPRPCGRPSLAAGPHRCLSHCLQSRFHRVSGTSSPGLSSLPSGMRLGSALRASPLQC